MTRKPFHLRRWFAISSFGIITAIAVFAAYLMSDFLTTSLLERESEVSQEFLESIITVDGVEMFKDDGKVPFVPSSALLDFAKHIVSIPGVQRVNIHSITHRILWSTEKSIVGQFFPTNDELDEAFAGRRVTEIMSLSTTTKSEHIAFAHTGYLIEAYIPVRAAGGKGPVVGVVELYKLPLALDATITSARRLVWLGAGIAIIVLFLGLYGIVDRGARVIERQQSELSRVETFAALGQMSSAVAHSLRNPMSTIRTSAELWRSDSGSHGRQAATEIIQEVDRMDSYVRDLLSYARAEPYNLQPVEPRTILESIVAKQKPALTRNRIELIIADERANGTKVMADALLLEQALTSVVTNAVEAMPKGGSLSIKLMPTPTSLRLQIADTGPGIPHDLIQRVSHSHFTTKSTGLGLGLVIARSIIERCKGQLVIESGQDSGTLVSVDLKLA